MQGLREERHSAHCARIGDIQALADCTPDADVGGGRGVHREMLSALVGCAYTPVLRLFARVLTWVCDPGTGKASVLQWHADLGVEANRRNLSCRP